MLQASQCFMTVRGHFMKARFLIASLSLAVKLRVSNKKKTLPLLLEKDSYYWKKVVVRVATWLSKYQKTKQKEDDMVKHAE